MNSGRSLFKILFHPIGRLLLVSLLENFCLLYDTNPERNHKTFYIICKTLSAMGIIEEEVSKPI